MELREILHPENAPTKTKQEIRDTTRGKPQRPANYQYGKKLPAWEPAETSLSRDEFVLRCEPLSDRILVKLLPMKPQVIIRPTKPGLIGPDCRNATVLKLGTGKRWRGNERIPFSVKPGDEVLIGNWVDLELEDVALCAEKDVRAILWRN